MPKNVDINIPRKDSERIVIYYPKALINSYNGTITDVIHLVITRRTWIRQITNTREFIYLCITGHRPIR